ncbi:MAG: hypothetical protein Q8M03_15695 [Legionella sp.]|nr:hypothetical protein [Legionella sp.]
MIRFFQCSSTAPHLFTKPMTTMVRDFQLAHSKHHGKIVKILLSERYKNTSDMWQYLRENIIKSHPHSLFVWTAPTSRSKGQHGDFIHPGHNFSSVTDETGEIVSFMSKTPDSTSVLRELKRVPDKRFENLPQTMGVFKPLFTSVRTEFAKWSKRASLVQGYPLYVHILPLIGGREALKRFENNVIEIVEIAEPYRLLGSMHPDWDQYIPASNCNSAVGQSIFGKEDCPAVHDLSCQEAAMQMVLKFVKNSADYIEQSNALGLTTGIEPPTISEDLYRALFTC